MTVVLFKLQPQKTQIEHFWLQILEFLQSLHKNFQFDQFKGADFKYHNIFENCSSKLLT